MKRLSYLMARAYMTAQHPRVLDVDLRDIGPKWTGHGSKAPGSNETYFLAMGPGAEPRGEVRNGVPVWDEQFGATIASLLGLTFTANQPVAAPIPLH